MIKHICVLLLLLASKNAYGEDDLPSYSFAYSEFIARMDENTVKKNYRYNEDARFSSIHSFSFKENTLKANFKRLRPRWDVEIFGVEFTIMLTNSSKKGHIRFEKHF